MEKDPAFLLYSKDWLQGTAQMSAEEKGVYIDLLCHQHQENGLPNDPNRLARIVHLSISEFQKIWEFLSSKFELKNGKLFNKKLLSVINDRSAHGEMRRIIGTFGRILRDFSATDAQKAEIRKKFDYKQFTKTEQQNLSKTISKWIANLIPIAYPNTAPIHEDEIEDEIEDEDGNEDGDRIGGLGERKDKQFLIPQMHDIWRTTFPTYTADRELDYPPLLTISNFIFKSAGISKDFTNTDNQIKILNTFQLIADQVNREPFWVNKPLQSIAKNIQEFYNKLKNPVNGNNSKQAYQRNRHDVSDDKLKEKLAERIKQRQQAGS